MRIFVTGASGHIGSAVVTELLDAGHQVVGLARSDASVEALRARGVQVQRGDLDDSGLLAEVAAASDGVVHLAYKHEAMVSGAWQEAVETEQRTVETFGAALAGSGKPLVIASGTLMIVGVPGTGTESDVSDSNPRAIAENTVIGFAEHGVRSAAIRLTPTVHSSLDHHGFIPNLIATARARGVAAYVGDGANRWPAVHTLDAAQLFRLAVESAPAGSRLHAVGDEGVPFRGIAEAIGRHLALPVVSIDPEQAGEHFGFLGALVSLDNPTSSARTQELLGWKPVHPGLIEDLDAGHYFAAR